MYNHAQASVYIFVWRCHTFTVSSRCIWYIIYYIIIHTCLNVEVEHAYVQYFVACGSRARLPLWGRSAALYTHTYMYIYVHVQLSSAKYHLWCLVMPHAWAVNHSLLLIYIGHCKALRAASRQYTIFFKVKIFGAIPVTVVPHRVNRVNVAAFLTDCYDVRMFGQRDVEFDFLSSNDCDTYDSS